DVERSELAYGKQLDEFVHALSEHVVIVEQVGKIERHHALVRPSHQNRVEARRLQVLCGQAQVARLATIQGHHRAEAIDQEATRGTQRPVALHQGLFAVRIHHYGVAFGRSASDSIPKVRRVFVEDLEGAVLFRDL